MISRLTPEEYRRAISAARLSRMSALKARAVDYACGRYHSSRELQELGYLGELAAAKAFGVLWTPGGEAHGYDFRLGRMTVDVKTRTASDYDLVIHPRQIHNGTFKADAVVLVVPWDHLPRTVFRLVGWVDRDTFRDKATPRPWAFNDAIGMAQEELYPISDSMRWDHSLLLKWWHHSEEVS